MPDNRIIQLLVRKMANEATDAELSELQNLLEMYPDGVYYEEVLAQLWTNETPDDNNLESIYNQHKLKYADDFEFVEQQELVDTHSKTRRYLLAACIILLIGASALFCYKTILNPAVLTTEIFAGKGIRKKVKLPDGTQVWLNGNSKLTFDSDLNTRANRIVNLEGEAYFDVTKDKHHPFIIHTSKFAIKVLGTAFNVKAYPDENVTEASLIRGSIELTVSDNQKQKILLKPNEKFTLADKKPSVISAILPVSDAAKRRLTIENIKPVEIESQEYIEETSWVTDKLVFKNESFDELVPKLERWYNVKIHIERGDVKEYHFTGMFKNESITQALKAMQLIRPFKFKITNDDVNIN